MEKELFAIRADVMADEKSASGLGAYADTFEPGWHSQIIFVTAHSIDEAKKIAIAKAESNGWIYGELRQGKSLVIEDLDKIENEAIRNSAKTALQVGYACVTFADQIKPDA